MGFINTIGKYLKNGMKVADIGAGLGHFGGYLKKVEGYKFDYVACDTEGKKTPTENYFKTFNVKDCKFITGDITKPLPFESEEFDMVWMFGVTFWGVKKIFKKNIGIVNPNTPKVFDEIYRILKPNGTFMFTMRYRKPHCECFNATELTQLLENAKFKIEFICKDPDNWVREHFVLVKK